MTSAESLKQEIYNCLLYKRPGELADISYQQQIEKLATGGGQWLKVINCKEWILEHEIFIDQDLGVTISFSASMIVK